MSQSDQRSSGRESEARSMEGAVPADNLSLAQSFLLQDPVLGALPTLSSSTQQQGEDYQYPHGTQQQDHNNYGGLTGYDFSTNNATLFQGQQQSTQVDQSFPSIESSSVVAQERTDGNKSKDALAQLQQNLMTILNQQQGPAGRSGNAGGMNGRSGSGILKDALAMEQDSNDMLAQYRQLFGNPVNVEGNDEQNASLHNNDSQQESKGNQSQLGQSSNSSASNSNRLFLGSRVEPLSGKPLSVEGKYSGIIQKDGSGAAVPHNLSNEMMKLYEQQQQLQKPNMSHMNNTLEGSNVSSGRGNHANGTTDNNGGLRALPTMNITSEQVDEIYSQQNSHGHGQPQLSQASSLGPATAMLQQQYLQQQNFGQLITDKSQQLFSQQHQPSQTYMLQGQTMQGLEQPAVPQQAEDVPENFGLPSTMLPPSVLISMLPPDNMSQTKTIPVKAGKTVVKPRKRKHTKYGRRKGNAEDTGDGDDGSEEVNPQQIFCDILEHQGYDRNYRLKADDSGYDAVPSPLQLASFGTQLVKAVHASDDGLLSDLLSCGLSPNPCNQFRDSILDLVCKRANLPIFECLLKHGADLQVVDGFGRTPLHHCCWASSFNRKIVESIMERDPVQIFLEDKHGQTPLEYVRTDLAGEWIDFLEEIALKVWPVGGQSPRLLSPKDRRPDGNLVDPPNAVSVSLAAMISAGSISPQQVAAMDDETRKNFQS